MSDLLSAVELTLDDRDPQAIFDACLDTYEALAPDAAVRNGSVEALLMEAMSVASADVIYALNRMPSIVLEGLLALYGVARSEGLPATGAVTIALDGTRALTVPAGSRLSDPETGLVLVATAEVAGTSVDSLTVPVRTAQAGGAGNGIPAGRGLDLIDAVPYAVSAQVTTPLTGGVDPEDDTAYVVRARNVLARVTSSLVLPSHFVAWAMQDPRVGRTFAADLYRPGGAVGEDLGHLTIYAYGLGGQLGSEVREELRAGMQAIAAAMLTVHVEPATVVSVPMSLTVQALPGWSTAAVRAAVATALAGWCTPAAWPWGRDVMPTEIIDVAADAPGVDHVVVVAAPAATVSVGDSALAQAGAITVTVTA